MLWSVLPCGIITLRLKELFKPRAVALCAGGVDVPTEHFNPIVDIALYTADAIPLGWDAVRFTPSKLPADISASSAPHGRELLLCYKRAYNAALPAAAFSESVLGYVTDICVVYADRDEVIPPNFIKVCVMRSVILEWLYVPVNAGSMFELAWKRTFHCFSTVVCT